LKILQMVQTLDPSSGGVARAVTALGHALGRLGNQIDTVALDEPTASWLAETELTVHPLGSGLTS